MLVLYKNNRNGGTPWLTEEDWTALGDAGWIITSSAIERTAAFECGNIIEAIRFWEHVTNQSANQIGCSCAACKRPHVFTVEGVH